MSRVFVYDGREFPDPLPDKTTEEVRQYFAGFFPELSNADTKTGKRKIEENPAEEEDVIEFKKRVGSKGSHERN
jgi:PRTRC genetic system protein C